MERQRLRSDRTNELNAVLHHLKTHRDALLTAGFPLPDRKTLSRIMECETVNRATVKKIEHSLTWVLQKPSVYQRHDLKGLLGGNAGAIWNWFMPSSRGHVDTKEYLELRDQWKSIRGEISEMGLRTFLFGNVAVDMSHPLYSNIKATVNDVILHHCDVVVAEMRNVLTAEQFSGLLDPARMLYANCPLYRESVDSMYPQLREAINK